VALVLTRQKVPPVDRRRHAPASGVARGGYVLADAEGGRPDVVLMASGSELSLVLEAGERLGAKGVRTRVVSMPSLELFAAQPQAYRDQVLPQGAGAKLAVEAAHPQPWYRWVGDGGAVLGIERFGASAPSARLFQEYGFTVDRVVARARELLRR
jgi:transketolase